MMTVFVTTVTVLALSLFALMAMVPLMLESRRGDDVPDNVVHMASRRRVPNDGRDAA